MIKRLFVSFLLAHQAMSDDNHVNRMLLQSVPLAAQTTTAAPVAVTTTSAAAQTTTAPVAATTAVPQTTSSATSPATTSSATTSPPITVTNGASIVTTSAPIAGTTAAATSSATTATPVAATTAAVIASTTSAPATTLGVPATPVTTATPPAVTTSAPISIPATTVPPITTAAPVVPIVTTSAPIITTAAPIITTTAAPLPTAAPTTPAPLPFGYQYGSFGQACPIYSSRDCSMVGQPRVHNNQGDVRCNQPGDCCLCGSIQCGSTLLPNPMGCNAFQAGDFAAFGVQQIAVLGNPLSPNRGASIECKGIAGCSNAKIFSDTVTLLNCDADQSCAFAEIVVNNPVQMFRIDCNGPESCMGLKLIVNVGIPPPPGQICNPALPTNTITWEGLNCGSREACAESEIIINNQGCDKLVIQSLDCLQPGACTNANFQFIGDIEVTDCFCGPSCSFTDGLGICFQNLERLLCPDPMSCRGMIKSIMNPRDLFYWECGSTDSCMAAQLTIQLTGSSVTTTIGSFKFGGVRSGFGATVTIENNQGLMAGSVQPQIVTVDLIECAGPLSCVNAQFILGQNVAVRRVMCSPGACSGCLLKVNEADPGTPCDPTQTGFAPIAPQTPSAVTSQAGFGSPAQGLPQFVPDPALNTIV